MEELNNKEYAYIKDGVVKTFAGVNVTKAVKASVLEGAVNAGEKIMYLNENGIWKRQLGLNAAQRGAANEKALKLIQGEKVAAVQVESPVMKLITAGIKKKPVDLYIEELKWKYLVRTVVRGKNVMMTGGTGTGKTYTAQEAAKALGKEFFYFNLGATQDPRSTLIGNTHFKAGEEGGTMFHESLFVKAIQMPGAVILLDELSRANPEAWNILMPVLDEGQRYLRLDEQENAPTIKVADGVSFIATANIGNEFTSTRVMDRALLDRFTIIEVDYLPEAGEVELLKKQNPDLLDIAVEAIANIATMTRQEMQTEDPKISTPISTRSTIELAGLMTDGFNLYKV